MKKEHSPTQVNSLSPLTKTITPLLIILFGFLVSCTEEPLADASFGSPNQPPAIIDCPVDIIQAVAAGAVPAVVEWTGLPLVIDPDEDGNALALAATANPDSGSMFDVGATTVTYTVTDSAGATDTCTFTVIVVEDNKPRLSACPEDIVVIANAGEDAVEVDWVAPTAIDHEDDNNNDATLRVEANYDSGDAFPVGETEVTYTATDSLAQEDRCTFMVTVMQDAVPILSACPEDMVVIANTGEDTAEGDWVAPTATDHEDDNNVGVTVNVESNYDSGDVFIVGNTEVTYTARDSRGQEAACSFTVTVNANTLPTIICPAGMTEIVNAGVTSVAVTWADPVVVDTEDVGESGNLNVVSTSGHSPGDTFQIGTTPVTYTVTDSHSGTNSCTFMITVTEDAAPTLSACPEDIVIIAHTGETAVEVDWMAPVATDNEDDNSDDVIVTVEANYDPGDTFLVGNTEVTYRARDSRGQEDACSFAVTVNANTLPTIACPAGMTEVVNDGVTSVTVTWADPVVTDTEDAGENDRLNVVSTSGHSPGDTFQIGTTPVTYTVTDSHNGMNSCTFMVAVTEDTAPTLSACPEDIVIIAHTGETAVEVDWMAPVATDNEDDNSDDVTVTVEANHDPGDAFLVGSTEVVTYTATDSRGQEDTCSFTVRVNANTSPIIACPTGIERVVNDGVTSASVTWADPVVTDTEDAGENDNLNVVSTSGHSPGDMFQSGTTSVTYTVTDSHSGTDSCTFMVTITEDMAPTLSACPGDMVVIANTGENTVQVDWMAPTATDNEDDNTDGVTVSVAANHEPGDAFRIGNTEVTYRARDSRGQDDVCSFTVRVNANTLPTIACPADITEIVNADVTSAPVTWADPVVSDTEDNAGSLIVVSVPVLGSTFDAGTTTSVTYTVTDSNRGTSSCTFAVVVTNASLPTILGCPGNISVIAHTGSSTAPATWVAPTATSEDGGSLSVATTHAPGTAFNVGNTEVTYTATDSRQQSGTCLFTVTVNANILPMITCPADIERVVNADVTSAVVIWADPIVTDTEDAGESARLNIASTSGHTAGDTFQIGTTSVTYTVTDSHSGTDSCTFMVVVTQDMAPILSVCPADIVAIAHTGEDTAEGDWVAPTATDNEDDHNGITVHVAADYDSGDAFSIGNTEVTYTARDSRGQEDTCSFTVRVNANTLPTIACPADIERVVNADVTSALVTWVDPIVTDTEDAGESVGLNVESTSGHTSGDAFQIGSTSVAYTVTDSHNGTNSCTFMVVVTQDTVPMLSACPADIVTVANTGATIEETIAVVTWVAPTATDVEDDLDPNLAVNVESTHSPGAQFPPGNPVQVTYTARDSRGQEDACSFMVTVNENNFPVITCPANETIDLTGTEETTASVTWDAPVISDVEDDMAGNVLAYTGTAIYETAGELGGTLVELTSDLGGVFSVGTTTVVYTVTDSHNGASECAFELVVIKHAEPTFENCPSNISRFIRTGDGNVLAVTWEAPSAIDENGNVIPVNSISSNFSPGAEFGFGTTTEVIYTATDSNNVKGTCSFDVIISDDYAPTFTSCPENITTEVTNLNDLSATVSWPRPTVIDAETEFAALTREGFYRSLGQYVFGYSSQQGNERVSLRAGVTTVVTYRVTDTANQRATCSFRITITTNGPVFVNCPENRTRVVATSAADTTTITWRHPSATDLIDGDFTAEQIMNAVSHQSGSIFPVGETEVIYALTDSEGYIGTCSFTVTISLNTVPTFMNCPNNRTIRRAPASPILQVHWQAPAATDVEDDDHRLAVTFTNSADVELLWTGANRYALVLGPGDTVITYTATDSHGDTGICSFTISILLNYPNITLVDSDEERILLTEAYAYSDEVTIIEIYIQKAPPLPSGTAVGSTARYITLDRIGIRSPVNEAGEATVYRDFYDFPYSSLPRANMVRLYEGEFYTLAFANGDNTPGLDAETDIEVSWEEGFTDIIPTIVGDCISVELTLQQEGVRRTHDYLQAGNGCDLIIRGRGIDWTGTLPIPSAGESLARSVRLSPEEAGLVETLGVFSASEWETATTRTPGHPTDATCISVGNVDLDEDGILDCLEVSGETYFGMSFYDWGARPQQKDIFVEVDYMPCSVTGDLRTQPDKATFERMEEQFNSYIQNGTPLKLHMDVGDLFNENINAGFNLGGGNAVISNKNEQSAYHGIALDSSYNPAGVTQYFLTKEKNFSLIRKPFFHYMLFAETHDLGGEQGNVLGAAELGGNDVLITMGGGGEESLMRFGLNHYSNCNINSPSPDNEIARVAKNYYQNRQAFTVLHELGHNLGLNHGGPIDDGKTHKPNYFSIMNYSYGNYGPPNKMEEDETVKRVRDAYYFNYHVSEGNDNCFDPEFDELSEISTKGSNFTSLNNGVREYGERQELNVFYKELDDFDLHFSSGGNSDISEESIDENDLFDISRSGGTWTMSLDINCDGAMDNSFQADVNFDHTNTSVLSDYDDINAIKSFFHDESDLGAQSLAGLSLPSRTSRVTTASVNGQRPPQLRLKSRRQRKFLNDRQRVVPAESERHEGILKIDFSALDILNENDHDHGHGHDHDH